MLIFKTKRLPSAVGGLTSAAPSIHMTRSYYRVRVQRRGWPPVMLHELRSSISAREFIFLVQKEAGAKWGVRWTGGGGGGGEGLLT